MRTLATAAIAAVLSLTAACGSDEAAPAADAPKTSEATTTETTKAPEPRTATEIGAALKADISQITKVETVTEDNDPNDKIGRPGGYVDGVVVFDSRAEPDDPSEFGVVRGAFLEVWPDEAAATERSEFIQGALKDADGLLGSEYHYQQGAFLLRVTGDLKPSAAKAYETTFNAQF